MVSKKGEPKDQSINLAVVPDQAITEDPWLKSPEFIRRFIEQRPHYEQLCDEVAYTLTKFLKDADIKIAAVTSRAKTLESFLEKIERKSYNDPFIEITDFAGARVVCFYPDDLPKIEALIRKEFVIAEREDKVQAREIDRFGYSATHFLVRLGKRVSGARYDDLKDKVCEIQVRTVLQDAWAIFSHHLMYKHENEIPDVLKREIHALAGALGTADTAFQAIRDKRDTYIKSVKVSAGKKALVEVETNLDSVREYLAQKFPGRIVERGNYLSRWLNMLDIEKYPTLQEVDDLLERTVKARDWYFPKVKPNMLRDEESSAIELIRALGIMHPEVRSRWPKGNRRDLLQQAEQFVEKAT